MQKSILESHLNRRIYRVKPKSVEERFWKFVNKTSGYWNWSGSVRSNKYPYGVISINDGRKRIILAHRLSYLIHFGPFDDSLLVCHSCDNPSCVRPDHLFLGTKSDNAVDALSKKRVPNQKLSFKNAEDIRKCPQITLKELAKKFNVSITTIWKIRTLKSFIPSQTKNSLQENRQNNYYN